MTKPTIDVAKLHFLGSVEYAQHNFARLKPVLYSEGGRRWDGFANAAWFPNEGLVFSVHADLRYAPHDSLWTFRVTANPRGEAADKDTWSAVQAKPAIELLVGLEPLDIEALRTRVTEQGLALPYVGKGGVGVPELDGRWVVLPEMQRDGDDQWRPASSANLKHLKVLIGAPEELCGLATQSGHYLLPPVSSSSGESRNWLPPMQFLETLASDLKRWVPHGAQKGKAHAAAQALRELAPYMSSLAALKVGDAKVAIARATNLAEAAETITGAAETILDLVVEQEPFKSAVAARRDEIDSELQAEALKAVEATEGAARDRLLAEHADLRDAIETSRATLAELEAKVTKFRAQVDALGEARVENIEALHGQIDAMLERAASEPARLLAEWIGVSGFVVGSLGGRDASEVVATPETTATLAVVHEPIAAEDLGLALTKASPAFREGDPPLLIIDAAIRARELPVLIGPLAREFAEAWLSVAGGSPLAILTDPTLLSVRELTPMGQRGERAPLAEAFARARASMAPVIVLLDDLDPAAASFWLPDLARCLRHPERHGFPPNLHFVALIEADPRHMGLTRARASELFPMTLYDCDSTGAAPVLPAAPKALPRHLFCDPLGDGQWPSRVAAFEKSLGVTHTHDKARALAASLAVYLRRGKGSDNSVLAPGSLEGQLDRAARLLVRDFDGVS